MCGITGIYRRSGLNPSDPQLLKAMTETIAHRGPDSRGFLFLNSHDGRFWIGKEGAPPFSGNVCMGNRRLAVIDLTQNAAQPMANETRDIFVLFNGEIYNYLELREGLAAMGHIFRSQSDTEVVVHAYEAWGAECVERFNGMWALAVWDQHRREMFCSRDRFGIKPFYYHIEDDLFLFASEIKGILPAMDGRPRADMNVLSEYLLDGVLCLTTDTFFEGVQRLEPAHNLVVSADGIRKYRYWDYPSKTQDFNLYRPIETFRDLLDDAVRLRLRSDVPVGVALSGGLDSTSVLACAAQQAGPQALKAFTAVFPGQTFNEDKYAGLASGKLGVRLFRVDYRPVHFVRDLRKVIWQLDYPAQEGQVLLRWRLMRLAARHVKVILEGQGADEMLGGYILRYFIPHVKDELAQLKSGPRLGRMKRLFMAWLDMYRRYGWPSADILLGQARKYLAGRNNVTAENHPYTPDFLHRSRTRPAPPWIAMFDDRLTNRMHFDHATGTLPMLLKYGDALSMASSVESRLPFLDHRLVEFVFRLPAHYKLDGSLSKGVLRQAMAGRIPERIRCRRDKVGFETPLPQWMADCLDSAVRPVLLSRRCRERGIFDAKRLERLLTQQALERSSMAFAIFRWFSAELWFRIFIDGEERPAVGDCEG